MKEGRRHASHHENKGQSFRAFLDRPTVVENILGHRESETNHAGINNAINDSVELVLLEEKQNQKNESLGAFFYDRRGNYGPKVPADVHTVRRRRDNHFIESV